MIVIGIDPGHGGADSGACWPLPPPPPLLMEKDLALSIARRLNQSIKGAGWDATSFLTREDDDTTNFATRRTMLDKHAADFVISIHVNAADPKARGLMVFHKDGDGKGWDVAKTIARCAPDGLLRGRNSVIAASNLPGTADDWTKRAWNVLSSYARPGVLVETGFISNDEDRKLLTQSYAQDGIVAACLAGVARLLAY